METSFSEGYMEYSDALRQAIAEMPLKWDLSTCDYQPQLAFSAEETEAKQQYGVENKAEHTKWYVSC